jgi:hypothetical protein
MNMITGQLRKLRNSDEPTLVVEHLPKEMKQHQAVLFPSYDLEHGSRRLLPTFGRFCIGRGGAD